MFPSRTKAVIDAQQGTFESLQNALLFAYERTHSYATDTIAMFDHFMDYMMPFIVREFSKIEVICNETKTKHCVQFGHVTVHKPLVQEMDSSSIATAKNLRIFTNEPLMPAEARARGLTQVAHVFVDIDYTIQKMSSSSCDPANLASQDLLAEPPTKYREVPLMNVPIMIRSKQCHLSNVYNKEVLKECLYDQGGYFIIRGNAKVIQPQKVQRINVHITHAPPGRPGQLPITCEIRSLRNDEKFRSTSTLQMHFSSPFSGSPPTLVVDIPFLAKGTPLLCVFRVLGFSTRTSLENFLWDSLDDARRPLMQTIQDDPAFEETMDQVQSRMGRGMYNEADLAPDKVRRQVQQQVLGELLPHVGQEDLELVRFKKAVYLRTMIHKILDVQLGLSEADDRDFEGYKCVHMSATILSTLFRQLFSMFVKTIRNKMQDRFKRNKHLDVAALVAHSDALSRDLLKAFSEGEVTVKQAANAGSGVIQMTHQINPLGISTHIQRVSTALPRDGKYTLMRGVDSTSLFSFCPAETPEGHGAGLLQNLTLFAKVRIGVDMRFVVDALFNGLPSFADREGLSYHCEKLLCRDQLRQTLVFVNGDPVASTMTPADLVKVLRAARRRHIVPQDTSIIQTFYGVLLFCDMGTVVFPLLHLESLRKAKLGNPDIWTSLFEQGILEQVDSWELLEYRVAMSPKDIENVSDGSFAQTHLAVHPCAILGTSSCTVPWSNHNQAPRVSQQAGMVKQAVGTPATNYQDRLDLNAFHVLWYPQVPMADTIVSEARKVHEWPMGENLMVAIASQEGHCQEDAIIRNRASIDRGSGRSTVYKMYKAVIRKIGADQEAFESPMDEPCGVPCIGIRGESDQSKVDHDGLPVEGTRVKNGDVLIGRVFQTSDDSGRKVRRDRSIIVICEDTETFMVDKVVMTVNRDGLPQVRVRLRTVRVPQVGDKISDRHGQKGVIGTLMNEEDLPYIMSGPNEGLRPDAIVNLHAINGRMTIAKLLEMLFSSLGLVLGDFADATPFQDISAKWALEELIRQGYGGEQTMVNGMTGEVMQRPWFIGSCFQQSLKHMVLDKVAARNRGPRAQLTRQPLDGRANQGGQRMGEMEKDAFLAHGASFALDDRSRVASDGTTAPVCEKCGQIGESDVVFSIRGLMSADQMDEDVPIQRHEQCRACGGPMSRIETTYCQSGLLVRELATLGIKVVHKMESEKIEKEEMVSSLMDYEE